jgi:ADP-glucose pyrophosphorylase
MQIETTIGRGCRIRNAIIDNCSKLPEGLSLGFDRAADEALGFKCVPIPESGEHIAVVPRNYGMNPEYFVDGASGPLPIGKTPAPG